jgi:hypothetical protein
MPEYYAQRKDFKILLRITADQDTYIRDRARTWRTPLNTALCRIIDDSRTERTTEQRMRDDPPGTLRVPLSARAQSYVADCAEKWGVTPEHAVQTMILNSYLTAAQPPASPAPPAPPRVQNPAGPRRQRPQRQRPTPAAVPTTFTPPRLDTWAGMNPDAD